jgi:ABC-type multidrug transport system permease subunit
VYTNPADYIFMDILNTNSTHTHGRVQSDQYSREALLMSASAIEDNISVDVSHLALRDMTAKEQALDKLPNDKRVSALIDLWKRSPECKQMDESVTHARLNPKHTAAAIRSLKTQADFSTQFSILAARASKNALRNKLIVKAKLGQTLFLGILVGLIFLQLGDDQRSIQNRNGSLFFLAVNSLFGPAISVLSVFAKEKDVFLREHLGGYYSLPAYLMSKIVVELPYQILFPFMYSVIVYFMIGYQMDAGRFFIFAVIMILINNCGMMVGIFAGSVSNELDVALAVLPLLLLPLMVFSGFFLNSATTPYYFIWVQYLSPIKYGFTAMVLNEYEGMTFTCPTNTTASCFRTGDQVIDSLGFADEGSVALNIGMLILLYGVLLILSYLNLYRIVKNLTKRIRRASPPVGSQDATPGIMSPQRRGSTEA